VIREKVGAMSDTDKARLRDVLKDTDCWGFISP